MIHRLPLVAGMVALCGWWHASLAGAELDDLEARVAAQGLKASASDLVALARAYETASRPLEAAAALDRAIAQGADAPELRLRQARLCEAAARWEDAVLAAKAAAAAGGSEAAAAHLRAAEILADRIGSPRRAAEEFAAVARTYAGEEGRRAAIRGIQICGRQRDLADLRSALEDILATRHGDDPGLLLLAAPGLVRQAAAESARDTLTRIRRLAQESPVLRDSDELAAVEVACLLALGEGDRALSADVEHFRRTRSWAWIRAVSERYSDRTLRASAQAAIAPLIPWDSYGLELLRSARDGGADPIAIAAVADQLLAQTVARPDLQARLLALRASVTTEGPRRADLLARALVTDPLALSRADLVRDAGREPLAGAIAEHRHILVGRIAGVEARWRADGDPVEAFAEAVAVLADLAMTDDGEALGAVDLLREIARGVDPAVADRTLRGLAEAPLSARVRARIAGAAKDLVRGEEARAAALADLFRATPADALARAAATKPSPAEWQALARAADAHPLTVRTWLWEQAIAASDGPMASTLALEAARRLDDPTFLRRALAWFRSKGGSDAEALLGVVDGLPAGTASLVEAEAAVRLLDQVKRSGDIAATAIRLVGEDRRLWSRDLLQRVAVAAMATGDQASFLRSIDALLERGDDEAVERLGEDRAFPVGWRTALAGRIAAGSGDPERRAIATLAAAEGDEAVSAAARAVLTGYPHAGRSRERALLALLRVARGTGDAAEEAKLMQALIRELQDRRAEDPSAVAAALRAGLEPRLVGLPPAKAASWLGAVVRHGGQSADAAWAARRLADLRRDEDPTAAVLALQDLVRTVPQSDRDGFDRVLAEIAAEKADGRPGVAAALAQHAAAWFAAGRLDADRIARVKRLAAEYLAASAAGVVVAETIDDRDPAAPILRAAALLASGDEVEAVRQGRAALPLLRERVATAPADLILAVARSLGGAGEVAEARELLHRFLAARSEAIGAEEDLARARIQLGDLLFQEDDLKAATLEFQAVVATWPKSRSAAEAGLRAGDCLLAERRFDEARKAYEAYLDHDSGEVRVRAICRLGLLAYQAGDSAAAVARFREAAALNPPKRLADELYLDWGRVLMDRNQLAEAEDVLVLAGFAGRHEPVAPGEPLRITLTDTFLQTSQSRSSVPIEVWTDAGDREIVDLVLATDLKGLFTGRIPTVLGEAVAGDRVLQLVGGDLVHYDYTEAFKEGRRIAAPGSGGIGVAANAELRAGATADAARFTDGDASPEDGDRPVFHAVTADEAREAAELARSESRRFRGAAELKPGNPIHVAVRDADRDLGPARDRLSVQVASSGGDLVQVDLVETEAHSGVFGGIVDTGTRPADLAVSDSAPGRGALDLLAGDDRAEAAWVAAPDRRPGKAITVDLKAVTTCDRFTWSRGRTEGGVEPDRLPTDWRLEASLDGRWWTVLHDSVRTSSQAGWAMQRIDRPRRITDDLRAARSRLDVANPDRLRSLDERGTGFQRLKALATTAESIGSDPTETLVGGAVLIPEPGRYEFAILAAGRVWLEVAGRMVVERTALVDDRGGDAAAPAWRGLVDLPRGQVPFRLLVANPAGEVGYRILWRRPGQEAFEDVPAVAVDARADRKAIAEHLGGFASVHPLEGRGGAEVRFAPQSTRYLRLVMDAWNGGDAPAVAAVAVAAGDQVLVPAPGVDYRALASDQALALSPGDTITVSYQDQITRSGRIETLRQRLKATWYDASIGFFALQAEERDGAIVERLAQRYRFAVGDRLVLRVVDYDADVSDGPDRVGVRFASASGDVVVDAIETGRATGVFQAEVRTAPPGTAAGAEPVLPTAVGDDVVASYRDADNTDPGQAVDRSATIRAARASAGGIAVGGSAWKPTGAAGGPAWVLETSEPGAEAAVVLAPLILRVVDPDACISASSRVRVLLTTTSGARCDVALRPERGGIQAGIFGGTVALALGTPTDPPWSAAPGSPAAGLAPAWTDIPESQHLGTAQVLDPEAPPGARPVLTVRGGDEITAMYREEDGDGIGAAGDPAALPPGPRAVARFSTPGLLRLTGDAYETAVETVHVGGRCAVRVDDADADRSDGFDLIQVDLTTDLGDRLRLDLHETDVHSGVFTGSAELVAATAAEVADARLQVAFGGSVTATYAEPERPPAVTSVAVAKGFDGNLAAFAKRFAEDTLATRTMIRLAEARFELYRRQRSELKEVEGRPGQEAEAERLRSLIAAELDEGVLLLRQVMAGSGPGEEADRVLYLLGQFEQESGQIEAAALRYQGLLSAYPASAYAPEAQYQIAQCHEAAGRFDEAWDAYVRLGYRWPDHELVADAMVHIGLFYQDRGKAAAAEAEAAWKRGEIPGVEPPLPEAARKDFRQASAVFARMVARFPDHRIADQIALAQANALMLAQDWIPARDAFAVFVATRSQSAQMPVALYWAGKAYLACRQPKDAYLSLARLIQSYPESTEAKLARGLMLEDARLRNISIVDEP